MTARSEGTPFPIHVDQSVLDDLAARLRATKWPKAEVADWSLGTSPGWLRELVEYWRSSYDWRGQEAWINEVLPGRRAHVRGLDLHFVSRRAGAGAAMPLLLLHGWPSSFVEMHRILDPLVDPVRYGGRPEDAFDVVVGSLPGHGFSSAPGDPRFGADEAADCFRDLMVEVLGHERFAVHGGDRGAFVATSLGHRHPDHVIALHQSLPMGLPGNPPSPEERSWLEAAAAWQREEGGYSALQSTRPLSLAYGLHDSPVGLAAWICEKFCAWSDCDGDPLRVFTRDELLTNVMVYWVTESFYASALFYYAHRVAPPAMVRPERIEVPTGICLFPKEVLHPPRSAVARKYDLRHWSQPERGGHFPALEAPDVLVEDLRRFLSAFR